MRNFHQSATSGSERTVIELNRSSHHRQTLKTTLYVYMESDENDSERSPSGNSEQEGEETDDDRSTLGDDSSIRIHATEEVYNDMIDGLSNSNGDHPDLVIESTELLLHILQNIDEFCRALSEINRMKTFTVGSLKDWPKVDITKENEAAWNKLCKALGSIEEVHTIDLKGQNLSGSAMAMILDSLPRVQEIWLEFPWHTVSGDDMQALVDILMNCQYSELEMSFDGNNFPTFGSEQERQDYLSAEPANHLEHHGIISQLLRLKRLQCVIFRQINLTKEECHAFASILTSDATPPFPQLRLERVTFPHRSGHCVATAFQSNQSVNGILSLEHVCEDTSFSEALASSLRYNESITTLFFRGEMPVDSLLNLLKNVARHNKTIATFVMRQCPILQSQLSEEDVKEIFAAFRENYAIKCLTIDGDDPIATICTLNAAGRSYLCEDANLKAKCIKVLGEVKENLDCLYFHLRENPVLCAVVNSSSDNNTVRKRKVTDDSGDEHVACNKLKSKCSS